MTPQLKLVIDAARTLSSHEKLELLQVIAHDLSQMSSLTETSAAFWTPRSLDEIAQTQSAPVMADIHALAVDFWPADESADDFNQFIAERRHADRVRKV
jgi:hypothetical protein